MIDIPQRVLDKIMPVTESGCWLWTGAVDRDGYGKTTIGGRDYRVHRLMLEAEIGRPIEGCALHHCDVPSCCRPSHLYEGSHQDNTNDKVARGRLRKNYTLQTYCKRGHLLAETAVLFPASKTRVCRICHNERRLKFLETHPAFRAAANESLAVKYRTDPVYREKKKAAGRECYRRKVAGL